MQRLDGLEKKFHVDEVAPGATVGGPKSVMLYHLLPLNKKNSDIYTTLMCVVYSKQTCLMVHDMCEN